MKESAPVALFAYNRKDHLRRVVQALAGNVGAGSADLIVFSDGPKDENARGEVAAVRRYLKTLSGFQSVTIVEREKNLGLAGSIIQGVTEILGKYDRVIVLEDDLLTSRFFLRYMNEALESYRDDDRVASIHGYVYPVAQILPETFFLRGGDCWGWACWRRSWQLFNPDGRHLIAELRRRGLTRQFDLEGAYQFSRMLEDQIDGANDSWAVRWHASLFLQDRLTLYPGRSLVANIGNDRSGRHGTDTSRFDVELTTVPIRVGGVDVKESQAGRAAFIDFMRRRGFGRNPLRMLAAIMRRLRKGIRDWIPPVVRRALRSVGSGIRFQGPYATWEEAAQASSGYDDPRILEKIKAAALQVQRGAAAYERDGVLFDDVEYSWPVLAGLLWAAAERGRLSVIDVGGSLGTSYFQNQKFLSSVAEVQWGIVEQAAFVACGQQTLQSEKLRFFDTIEQCAAAIQPNAALLSSVLQYVKEYDAIVRAVTALRPAVIAVDRTIVNLAGEQRIYVQRVPASIYSASYPVYSLPESVLIAGFERRGYDLVADFDSLAFPALEQIGSKFKGYIFHAKTDR